MQSPSDMPQNHPGPANSGLFSLGLRLMITPHERVILRAIISDGPRRVTVTNCPSPSSNGKQASSLLPSVRRTPAFLVPAHDATLLCGAWRPVVAKEGGRFEASR